MADNKFERCTDERDPDRCHGINRGTSGGQCMYKRVPGCNFCVRHGGYIQENANKATALKNYRLTQYAARVGDLSNNPEIKNLREEIGILRMTLEEVINQCESANKVLLYSEKITNLVDKIDKLVRSCQVMEEKNGSLMSRTDIINIADSIVTLIGDYIDDPDVLTELGSKICATIAATGATPTNPVGASS